MTIKWGVAVVALCWLPWAIAQRDTMPSGAGFNQPVMGADGRFYATEAEAQAASAASVQPGVGSPQLPVGGDPDKPTYLVVPGYYPYDYTGRNAYLRHQQRRQAPAPSEPVTANPAWPSRQPPELPQRLPQELPQRLPQGLPQRVPQQLPQTSPLERPQHLPSPPSGEVWRFGNRR